MKKQRIVVKVGTSTLTHDSGSLNLRSMEHLVRALRICMAAETKSFWSPPAPSP